MAKRYFSKVSRRRIRAEFACARFAYDNGVPTWRPDHISEDGRSIVGSRVEATPLSVYVMRRPWRMRGLMAELGRIHAGMHRLEPAAAGLRPWRVSVRLPLAEGAIPGLSERQMARANDILRDAMPDAGFCHGDLAPANLRVREGRPALFDWGRAGVGVRAVDVANAYCFLFGMPARARAVPGRARLAFRARAAETYLSAYVEASGAPRLPIELWALWKLARVPRHEARPLQRSLAEGAFLRLLDRVTDAL